MTTQQPGQKQPWYVLPGNRRPKDCQNGQYGLVPFTCGRLRAVLFDRALKAPLFPRNFMDVTVFASGVWEMWSSVQMSTRHFTSSLRLVNPWLRQRAASTHGAARSGHKERPARCVCAPARSATMHCERKRGPGEICKLIQEKIFCFGTKQKAPGVRAL